MFVREINETILDLYCVEFNKDTTSNITDKFFPKIHEIK